jgi:HTH-type transcriptional regulator/antitoxin MqsA
MHFDLDRIRDKVRTHRSLPPPAVRRALREEEGLTQDDVGQAIGVHRETVSRWERGQRTPRGEHRAAYTDLLQELRES